MNELQALLVRLIRLSLVVGIACWLLLLAMETHVLPHFMNDDFIGFMGVGCSIGFVVFLAVYLMLVSASRKSASANPSPRLMEPKPESKEWDSYDDAIRELNRIQTRIEERVTNLETILLSRTHDGVRVDKY